LFFLQRYGERFRLSLKKRKTSFKKKKFVIKKRKICSGNGSAGHKAGRAALGLSCGACFERLAGVFANRDASVI
jgi:hypothetical protein